MAININYPKHNIFINKNPYDFKIVFPMLWREVEESNKEMHTFIQFAKLWNEHDENKTVMLPHRMWTRSGKPRLQEGEDIQYIWDYNEAWDLNNISYKK